MIKKISLSIILLVCLAAINKINAQPAKNNSKPNIILIFTDDLYSTYRGFLLQRTLYCLLLLLQYRTMARFMKPYTRCWQKNEKCPLQRISDQVLHPLKG